MSALRSVGSRHAVFLLIYCALAVGACRVGANPAMSPTARSPRGVVVNVQWHASGMSWDGPTGELLGLDTLGIYLLHGDTIALYRYGTSAVLRPEHSPPDAFDLRPSNEPSGAALAQYARYPFGIDEQLLGRLLGAVGADSVVVRGSP